MVLGYIIVEEMGKKKSVNHMDTNLVMIETATSFSGRSR